MKPIHFLPFLLAISVATPGRRGQSSNTGTNTDTDTDTDTTDTEETDDTSTDSIVSKFPKKHNDYNSRKLLHTMTVFLTATMYVFIPLYILLQRQKLTQI